MNQQEILVKLVLDAWNNAISRTDTLINSLTDEELACEASPGRNRGIYLLGHLAAVHDKMIPVLNLGERLYPHLDAPFLDNPDRTVSDIPPAADLRVFWREVNTVLARQIATLSADDWFKKHNAVSEENFVKQPHRNRLNIMVSRINHVCEHLGQMLYLKQQH